MELTRDGRKSNANTIHGDISSRVTSKGSIDASGVRVLAEPSGAVQECGVVPEDHPVSNAPGRRDAAGIAAHSERCKARTWVRGDKLSAAGKLAVGNDELRGEPAVRRVVGSCVADEAAAVFLALRDDSGAGRAAGSRDARSLDDKGHAGWHG